VSIRNVSLEPDSAINVIWIGEYVFDNRL